MATIFRTKELTFKTIPARLAEFSLKTSPRLAKLAGARQLQFDLRSLDPGRFSFPYHFHRAAEELFLILAGAATLRSPEGFQEVREGDLLFFGEGPEGAHQLYNHGQIPLLYLDIRTTMGVDVCEYPDSGKVNILPAFEVYEVATRVDYYQGEKAVMARWPTEIVGRPLDPA